MSVALIGFGLGSLIEMASQARSCGCAQAPVPPRHQRSVASLISGARLIAPSAVTHVTNVDQRSIELNMVRQGNSIAVTISRSVGLVPTGWYMPFVANPQNTPSDA